MTTEATRAGTGPEPGRPLLELTGLRKEFGGRVTSVAVDDVSLTVNEGETLALVGESGCGKTTLTRLLLRLVEPTAGSVRFDGQDLGTLSAAGLRRVRRQMQVVLQDPYSSMNPRMRITDIVAEPLVTHDPAARGRRGRARTRERVGELLDSVGLDAGIQDRYPHEFSGGQRQRVSIARALALAPRLVVLDEPTSALDVSVQARILDLLAELQQRLGLTLRLRLAQPCRRATGRRPGRRDAAGAAGRGGRGGRGVQRPAAPLHTAVARRRAGPRPPQGPPADGPCTAPGAVADWSSDPALQMREHQPGAAEQRHIVHGGPAHQHPRLFGARGQATSARSRSSINRAEALAALAGLAVQDEKAGREELLHVHQAEGEVPRVLLHHRRAGPAPRSTSAPSDCPDPRPAASARVRSQREVATVFQHPRLAAGAQVAAGRHRHMRAAAAAGRGQNLAVVEDPHAEDLTRRDRRERTPAAARAEPAVARAPAAWPGAPPAPARRSAPGSRSATG